MKRKSFKVMIMCVLSFILLGGNVAVLADVYTTQQLGLVEKMAQQNGVIDIMKDVPDPDPTSIEGSTLLTGDNATSSSGFTMDIYATLRPSLQSANMFYWGYIVASKNLNHLSIKADLEYRAPTGGAWITEVTNSKINAYLTNTVTTPHYIQPTSWGYYRCKATGSYTDATSWPVSQTGIDYSTSYYFE